MIKHILLFSIFFFQFCFLKAGIVVLNGLSHSYQTENGKVYKGKIEIENTGTQSQSVKFFFRILAINLTVPSTVLLLVPITKPIRTGLK